MGRAPCCEKVGLKKGRWASEEDELLINYIKTHGEGSWRALPKKAGLLRCGKSCRLRWINYLREDLKRGNITQEEDQTIIKLQASLGNRWSAIAAALPGRTDNEIKNYWNAHLIKKITNLEGADDQRKRKRVDSNEQEAAKRRKARKVRSEDDDYSKGGDKALEEVTKKRRKKDSRRELQKQKEEDEKGKPKKGEVVVEEEEGDEEEEEAAITLTTSTITVEEVLQFVDEEVPVPEPAGDDEVGLDRGFELMRAGLEEEINSDIKEVDIIGEGFWPPTEHEEKESGGNIIDVRDVKTTDINIDDNNNRDDDGDDKNNRNDDRDDGNSSPGPWPEEEDGIRNLFKWEGLEDMPWELIGDTWHSIGEGNGESSDSPSTVIDGHDPFEEDLESWLFSDIV